jgi:hypothetical protein
MAKGYTSNALVASELGVTLTGPQATFCDVLIAEAEAWLDGETERTWLVTVPITAELAQVRADGIRLKARPVASVQSVTVSPAMAGSTSTTLVANRDYALLDPAGGLLWLNGMYAAHPVAGTYTSAYAGSLASRATTGYLATVAYTPVATGNPLVGPPLPADLAGAIRRLVAAWLRPGLVSSSGGVVVPLGSTIKRYQIGPDLQVEYANSAAASGASDGSGGACAVPADIAEIVGRYKAIPV